MVIRLRKLVGHLLFNHLIRPPKLPNDRLKPHRGDYGHAFLYEPLFCRDSKDIERVETLINTPASTVLDLAGGCGRVAVQLARRGHRVTLVDRSRSMLHHAHRRRRYLDRVAQESFDVIEQDIRHLNLKDRFKWVLSVNNGLEHLTSELDCLETLRRVYDHLLPQGRAMFEVHHRSYWERQDDWGRADWSYGQDLFHQGERYRVWNRTWQSGAHVRWEHAVTSDLRNYTWLQTKLLWLSPQRWLELMEEAGFVDCKQWSNWDRNTLTEDSPKLILEGLRT